MVEMESRGLDPRQEEGVVENSRTKIRDAVDLKHFAEILWRYKWLVLIFTFLGILKGVNDIRNFQPLYTAKMVVSPVSGSENRGSQVSGTLETFGLKINNEPDFVTPFDRLTYQFSSTAFAKHLQEKYGLMQRLFSSQWMEDEKKWKTPIGREFELRSKLRRFFKLNLWSEPHIADLANHIKNSVIVKMDPEINFTKITYRNRDPEFALKFLELVYREADARVRKFEWETLIKKESYIENQLVKQTQTDLRKALYSLYEEQLRKKMLFSREGEFAAIIEEPLHLENRMTEPNIQLLIAAPALAGFLLSSVLILLVTLFREAE